MYEAGGVVYDAYGRPIGTTSTGSTKGVRETLGSAGDFLKGYLGKAGQVASNLPVGSLGLAGAAIAPIGTAIEEAQEGRPTGALGALTGGGAGAFAGRAIGGAALKGLAAAPGLAGAVGKVGMLAAPVIGGMLGSPLGAQAAEGIRQKVTGEPTKGKEGEFKTQMAMRQQLIDQAIAAENTGLMNLNTQLKDLSQFYNQAQVEQYKAMAPLLEKTKMNDFARYQNAVAQQGRIQGQLGVLATAGALAKGAQAGNYGLAQSVLTNNPYASATLNAPQIRFG
jgi:hypothetical protein